MKLELTIHDSRGAELNFGDIVEIIGRSYVSGQNHKFYCEVTYLHEVEAIAPFHTFAFHGFTKVDKVPDGAIKSIHEERYNMWYLPDAGEDEERGESGQQVFDKYLMDWRECEHLLEQKIFRIKFPAPEPKPAANPKQLTLL